MYQIVGFSDCPYCKKAKNMLDEMQYEYDFVYIEDAGNRKVWMDSNGFETPNRTFPKIWEDDVYIGGSNDLEKHLLDKL